MKNILPLILILIIGFVTYGVFNQINKIDPKTKRISCQNKTITFEKINFNEAIIEAIDLLESNNYTLEASIDYSSYMKSHLVDILSLSQANEIVNKTIKKFVKSEKESEKKLDIIYNIYENDKEDIGKKGAKSKLYEGYLLFEFKIDGKQVYKIQTDYMDIDAKDLEERMSCVFESFTSIK